MVEHGTILPSNKGVGSHRTVGFSTKTTPTLHGDDLKAYKAWLRKKHLGDTPENLQEFTGNKRRFML